MIDLTEKSGREIAHFMYAELEKIAARMVPGVKSVAELAEQGMKLRQTYKAQPFSVTGIGSSVPRTNRSLRKGLNEVMSQLDGYESRGRQLLREGKLAEGNALLKSVADAKRSVKTGRPNVVDVKLKPPTDQKPKATPEKSPTLGERFDRLANLTGKGVIGAGTTAGVYGLYQASQPSSPYTYG